MKLVPQGISRKLAGQVLKAKKNSPHIFFAGGVAGIITSGVLACRATLKLEEKVDGIRDGLEALKQTDAAELERAVTKDQAASLERVNSVKQTTFVVVKSATTMGRLYGPSVALGAVSIAALTGSHIQLTRRNTALAGALAAVTKAYDEYRVRVRSEVGAERELEIHRAMEKKEVIGEDGKKTTAMVGDPSQLSMYARFFDESCGPWQKDAEMNLFFLKCQEKFFNDRLHATGHVFLNEIYDALGIPRSKAGTQVGWVSNGEKDNFIDFGMFEPSKAAFIAGYERSILLDFNVDGPIFQLLDDPEIKIVRHITPWTL